MSILHYLDRPTLPPVGSQAWIAKKTTTPTLSTPTGWRPTSEPLISPDYNEDWGPSKEYRYIVYLAVTNELIAGDIVEPNERTTVMEDHLGQREISRGFF
jgi:hypothetical protein